MQRSSRAYVTVAIQVAWARGWVFYPVIGVSSLQGFSGTLDAIIRNYCSKRRSRYDVAAEDLFGILIVARLPPSPCLCISSPRL